MDMNFSLLPTGFNNPGDLTFPGQVTETNTAHTKTSKISARTATKLASVVSPDFELGL
jgi:hypothetical protein